VTFQYFTILFRFDINSLLSAKMSEGSQKSIVSWLRKHRGIVTFLGACVVFATYIYKEILLDDAKTQKEAYENARVMFSIRDSLVRLSERVRRLEVLTTPFYEDKLSLRPKQNGNLLSLVLKI
jgi:hypothetical protein